MVQAQRAIRKAAEHVKEGARAARMVGVKTDSDSFGRMRKKRISV